MSVQGEYPQISRRTALRYFLAGAGTLAGAELFGWTGLTVFAPAIQEQLKRMIEGNANKIKSVDEELQQLGLEAKLQNLPQFLGGRPLPAQLGGIDTRLKKYRDVKAAFQAGGTADFDKIKGQEGGINSAADFFLAEQRERRLTPDIAQKTPKFETSYSPLGEESGEKAKILNQATENFLNSNSNILWLLAQSLYGKYAPYLVRTIKSSVSRKKDHATQQREGLVHDADASQIPIFSESMTQICTLPLIFSGGEKGDFSDYDASRDVRAIDTLPLEVYAAIANHLPQVMEEIRPAGDFEHRQAEQLTPSEYWYAIEKAIAQSMADIVNGSSAKYPSQTLALEIIETMHKDNVYKDLDGKVVTGGFTAWVETIRDQTIRRKIGSLVNYIDTYNNANTSLGDIRNILASRIEFILTHRPQDTSDPRNQFSDSNWNATIKTLVLNTPDNSIDNSSIAIFRSIGERQFIENLFQIDEKNRDIYFGFLLDRNQSGEDRWEKIQKKMQNLLPQPPSK